MSAGVNDWLECAKWLAAFKVLSCKMNLSIQTNRLELANFAYELRDGVILCNLINKLVPGYIDVKKINNPSLTQNTSYQNANLFLKALKSYFKFSKQDLFEPDMLYNIEIERVLKTLSLLSQKKSTKAVVKKGFTLSGDNNFIDNVQDTKEEESADDEIYYDAYEEVQKNDSCFLREEELVKEIIEVESQYISIFEMLEQAFSDLFSEYIEDEGVKIYYINIKLLKRLHEELFYELLSAYDSKNEVIARICFVFKCMKLRFMREHANYFSSVETVIQNIKGLENQNNYFVSDSDDDDSRTSETVELSHLMRLTYLFILEYPAFIEKLNIKLDEKSDARKYLCSIWATMKEISNYLIVFKNDYAYLEQIKQLSQQLSGLLNPCMLSLYGHFIRDDVVKIDNGVESAKTYTLLMFDKAILVLNSVEDYYVYKDIIIMGIFELDENLNSDSNDSLNLVLVNADRSKTYKICCEDEEQKDNCKNSIDIAFDRIRPIGCETNGHSFSLRDFGTKITICHLCKKVLNGVFYQGYTCGKCGAVGHKDCLKRFTQCWRLKF